MTDEDVYIRIAPGIMTKRPMLFMGFPEFSGGHSVVVTGTSTVEHAIQFASGFGFDITDRLKGEILRVAYPDHSQRFDGPIPTDVVDWARFDGLDKGYGRGCQAAWGG